MNRLLLLFCVCVSAAGCTSGELETGYRYTKLGDSQAKQRGYYAGPFSKEARQAALEADDFDRRPKPGY
jgi:hypothetical protein